MSYALLKGFVFAGLSKDDPRVASCWKWLSDHYTLDVNPGFDASSGPIAPYQGLFYYFHTMGKALDVYGADTIKDSKGVEHDWRAELSGRLTSLQGRTVRGSTGTLRAGGKATRCSLRRTRCKPWPQPARTSRPASASRSLVALRELEKLRRLHLSAGSLEHLLVFRAACKVMEFKRIG